jgi:hypothetical protein
MSNIEERKAINEAHDELFNALSSVAVRKAIRNYFETYMRGHNGVVRVTGYTDNQRTFLLMLKDLIFVMRGRNVERIFAEVSIMKDFLECISDDDQVI